MGPMWPHNAGLLHAHDKRPGRQLRALRPEGRGRGTGRRGRSIAAPSPATISSCTGEMLYLPPGQGFSIYSLAALLPLLPAKQRQTDPNDWMTTDAEVACPDPQLPDAVPHHADRQAPLPPWRDDRRAAAAGATAMSAVEAVALAPGYADLAGHPRRLAARRRPWAGRPRGGDRRHGRLLRRRHHHLRLRRHLYRRRGADRPVSRRVCRPARRGGAGTAQGPHQVRARPRACCRG